MTFEEEKHFARNFLEKAVEGANMQYWSIPPHLQPLFVGYDGFYPLYVIVKEIIEKETNNGNER